MEQSKKSMTSVMLSCTKNVLLTVAGIYLFYLFCIFLDDNSTSIASFWSIGIAHITSFFAIFTPIKDFLFEHLGKIFIGWLIITAWSFCVIVKLEWNGIETPKIFNILLFLAVPIGSIILFMFSGSSVSADAKIMSSIFGFLLLLLFVVISFSLVVSDSGSITNKEGTTKPEQLELFDKK